MAHIMNMAHNELNQCVGFPIASIAGAWEKKSEVSLQTYRDQQIYEVLWDGPRAIISARDWYDATWIQRIALIRGVLAIFNCLSQSPEAQIHWLFSGLVLRQADSGDLIARWSEESGPPVLDFVAFLLHREGDAQRVTTHGLAAIVGHEIEALVGDETPIELGQMVGHLAQAALRSGPLQTKAAVDSNGRMYQLNHVAGSTVDAPIVQIFEHDISEMDQSLGA